MGLGMHSAKLVCDDGGESDEIDIEIVVWDVIDCTPVRFSIGGDGRKHTRRIALQELERMPSWLVIHAAIVTLKAGLLHYPSQSFPINSCPTLVGVAHL